ncbi:MAG: hypothetical protein OEZ01_09720 [Candidatus Heimdallarchaeota archaeon]|nr:hypothetical protein [Candidatus Heimdallarchaeota archaeon]MDH5646275.1 hypothetical protein [Candidatus Heimdallarchaeota archaeon]
MSTINPTIRRTSSIRSEMKSIQTPYTRVVYDNNTGNITPKENDIKAIKNSLKNNSQTRITSKLSDLQLLALHRAIFLEQNLFLIFHHRLGIYELKDDNQTLLIFYYENGNYQIINSLC